MMKTDRHYLERFRTYTNDWHYEDQSATASDAFGLPGDAKIVDVNWLDGEGEVEITVLRKGEPND